MILVEYAVVVTMDPARRILLDGAVLIDGERIAQVGRAADVRPPQTPERVIDGRGHLVLPGGVASTTRFVRFVGPAKAKEIIMGCHRYSAAEAQVMGLVTRVVPGSELEGAVKNYAQHLLKKPFRALAEVKARINAISSNGTPIINAMTEGFLDRG